MPYRCREKQCAKRFSPKTGTVMEGSKLGLQVWMIATYLVSTSLKSVSSMKLHRDLTINQRSAWFLAHRLRVALTHEGGLFAGPVEGDETYVGGKRANMSKSKREELTGRGAVGKTAIAGAKDRDTNQVRAQVVERTDKPTVHGFVAAHVAPDAKVYTGYSGETDHRFRCEAGQRFRSNWTPFGAKRRGSGIMSRSGWSGSMLVVVFASILPSS